MLRWSGSGDIKQAVRLQLEQRGDLRGKVVVDLPAGSGANSRVLHRLGAQVEAYDLMPELFEFEPLHCRNADLQQRLPIDDAHADLALFQEGIEHLPDPLFALREFARILKPGGRLLLTTPNVSHLRGRLSHLLLESDLHQRLAPDSSEAIWMERGGRTYFGHLFLIGASRLLTLARVAGLRWVRLHAVKASSTSLLLLPLAYPGIALTGWYAFWRTRRRLRRRGLSDDSELRELRRINADPAVLAGKHLFIEFERVAEPGALLQRLSKPRADLI